MMSKKERIAHEVFRGSLDDTWIPPRRNFLAKVPMVTKADTSADAIRTVQLNHRGQVVKISQDW